MRVFYKKDVRQEIKTVILESLAAGREIEGIVLTPAEWEMVGVHGTLLPITRADREQYGIKACVRTCSVRISVEGCKDEPVTLGVKGIGG